MRHRLILLILSAALAGCAGAMQHRLAEWVMDGSANHDDPTTVATALPSYLLIMDGAIAADAEDEALLAAAGRGYAIYATLFTDDALRSRRLSERAYRYARRAFCLETGYDCREFDGKLQGFDQLLEALDDDLLAVSYTLVLAWGSYSQFHADDWNALARLAQLQRLLDRLQQIDERYEHGALFVMQGLLATRLPPPLGGQPERGREYFERAWAISQGQNLAVKVYLADRYARAVQDRRAFERLLREVIASPVQAPGLTLSNVMAQRRAEQLLAQADEYF